MTKHCVICGVDDRQRSELLFRCRLWHFGAFFLVSFVLTFVIYSSLYEVIEFTRDYEQIRNALNKIEHYDKTCVDNVLVAVNNLFQATWGNTNYCQLIFFTDCGIGIGPNSIRNTVLALQNRQKIGATEILPFPYPSNLSFVCLGDPSDGNFKSSTVLYQQLLDISRQKGALYIPQASDFAAAQEKAESDVEMQLSKAVVGEMVQRMIEANYQPFEASLKCGGYSKLETTIVIWPAPMPHTSKDVFGAETTRLISRKLEICGYLNLSDIGSPMTVSRHLILPKSEVGRPKKREGATEFEKLETDIKNFYSKSDGNASEEEAGASHTAQSESNRESVCVLLHGALKIENVAALALLNDDWFGFIYSYADNKKKSNLMLTILPPGHDVVPWLGDLRFLGTADDALVTENPAFPVKPAEKRSYSQNIVVWIRQAGLQSDIQKVLRHAKKLPEKTQNFYKELNRIKRAALSLGFVELLDGLSVIFEREIPMLPATASPDSAIQLKHAALELRKLNNRDMKSVIGALPSKFNQL